MPARVFVAWWFIDDEDGWLELNLTLDQLEQVIGAYEESLCPELDAGGLYARNNTAHKWKVTYRTIVLRELVSWRFVDLIKQALLLEKAGHFIGSRVLIRSAIETLALLIYSVRKMENIVRTGNGFHEYSQKSVNLLLGSKASDSSHVAVNVMEVIKHASKKHSELMTAYETLSETAHPNFDGLSWAYSNVADQGMHTKFGCYSGGVYGKSQGPIILMLLGIFEAEYNDSWPAAFDKFESWIEANDKKLEATRTT